MAQINWTTIIGMIKCLTTNWIVWHTVNNWTNNKRFWKHGDFKNWEPWCLKDLFPFTKSDDLYWAVACKCVPNPAFPPWSDLLPPWRIRFGEKVWEPYRNLVHLRRTWGKFSHHEGLTKRSFYVIIKLVGLGRSTSGLVEGQAHRTVATVPYTVGKQSHWPWPQSVLQWLHGMVDDHFAYRDLLFVSYTPIPYTHLVSLSVARWAHNLWSIVHEP